MRQIHEERVELKCGLLDNHIIRHDTIKHVANTFKAIKDRSMKKYKHRVCD